MTTLTVIGITAVSTAVLTVTVKELATKEGRINAMSLMTRTKNKVIGKGAENKQVTVNALQSKITLREKEIGLLKDEITKVETAPEVKKSEKK